MSRRPRRPRNKSRPSVRRLFLCSTFFGLRDLREVITEFLRRQGVKVIRSEDADFAGGSVEHKHDICLRRVQETSNFLLIIDGRAGKPYCGSRSEFQGLTITHAETRTALGKGLKSWNCFIRQDVLTKYEVWVHNKKRDDIEFEGVDKEVFRLLDEIETSGRWRQTFNGSDDLKASLKKLFKI